MIRTLLLTSMILASEQLAAFPVLYYGDIQQELAALKYEAQPLKVLSVIEAHVQNNLIHLSYQERMELIEQLKDLRQNLCKTEALVWPWLITAVAGITWLVNVRNAMDKGNGPDQEAYWDACDSVGRSFMYFGVSLFAALIIDTEYFKKTHIVQARNIEKKINNIITLLEQQ